jgi:hypothetical protein
VKTTLLQRRIAKLEARIKKLDANEPSIYECWVDEGDGILRHQDGRSMTREAFKAASPDSKTIRLKIFDKELPRRGQCEEENGNSETEEHSGS